MKAMKITLILLVAAATITFMKTDRAIDLRRALPFCDGEPLNVYHVTALVLLLIWLWGMARLRRRDDDR
jgi:hypothetical protein